MIIDGEGLVVGRVASYVAKKLLEGEEITIVNAEKMVIAGKPENTLQDFMERRQRGRPQKGPFFPRRPDMIVRRIVRGMLPMKKAKGREAFKRLRVYMGIPEHVKGEFKKIGKTASDLRTRYVTISEVSRHLGWNR